MNYLSKINIKNKTVLLRVDVNVPLTDSGKVADGFRIDSVVPTIRFLRERGCKVIICGHLGRPAGHWLKTATLKPVAEEIALTLNLKFAETAMKLPKYKVPHFVFFTGNIQEESVRLQIQKISAGDVVMLENLRYYPGEEKNDAFLARQLASLADAYVNDAFSVSHRANASVAAITQYLPSMAGLLFEHEVKGLSYVLNKPKAPFVCMMGGMKMSDKIKTLEHLAKRADKILLGGGLANLIFLSRGFEIGLSKVEKESLDLAWQIDRNLKSKLLLPVDAVVANSTMDKKTIRVTDMLGVRPREVILDIGPKTILAFAGSLKKANTIVWNGPLGHFEVKPFHMGTTALARVIGGVSKGRCYGVAGGGETVDVVRMAHQAAYYDHLSTGGGAMLDFLAGEKLPGIAALERKS